MSEQKVAIPEGLADVFQAAKLHEYGKISIPARTVLSLIERISRLESDAGVLSCGHPAAMWEEVGYADYCGVCKLEAEIAALKSTVASMLSIDDSKVAEYVVLDAEALKQAAGNRVAELEAKVARLEAPVNDEEWAFYSSVNVDRPWRNRTVHRTQVDKLIASRSTPPAKEASEGDNMHDGCGGVLETHCHTEETAAGTIREYWLTCSKCGETFDPQDSPPAQEQPADAQKGKQQ